MTTMPDAQQTTDHAEPLTAAELDDFERDAEKGYVIDLAKLRRLVAMARRVEGLEATNRNLQWRNDNQTVMIDDEREEIRWLEAALRKIGVEPDNYEEQALVDAVQAALTPAQEATDAG